MPQHWVDVSRTSGNADPSALNLEGGLIGGVLGCLATPLLTTLEVARLC